MRRPILVYCLIAFGLTWAIVFALIIAHNLHLISDLIRDLLHSLGAIGPAAGALIAARHFYGVHGSTRLISGVRFPRFGIETLVIMLSPLIFFGVGLGVHRIATHEWFDFHLFAENTWRTPLHFIAWLLPMVAYGILEEIGWRGFLLPHLQQRHSAWVATLYLTIIWATWHAPFFLYRFAFSVPISIGFFFGLCIGATILTSLYNSARGALGTCMCFHFVNNLGSGFDKQYIVATISTGLLFVAIYLLIRYPRAHLSRSSRVTNYFVA